MRAFDDDEGGEMLGVCPRGDEADGSAVGVRDDVRGRAHGFDDPNEVEGIIREAVVAAGGPIAVAVAAEVEGDDVVAVPQRLGRGVPAT